MGIAGVLLLAGLALASIADRLKTESVLPFTKPARYGGRATQP
jgi:hypothetical protein